MKQITAKRLCRAAVIAALYTVLTYVFSPFAFGPFQIRPAEALCILPLFFIESIPALFVGCALSNLSSPYFFYDVVLGSSTTLLAAFVTYLVGRFCKKDWTKLLLGGIPPVLFNAFVIPSIILFLYGDTTATANAYFLLVLNIGVTQCIWVYGLGAALYFAMKKTFYKQSK